MLFKAKIAAKPSNNLITVSVGLVGTLDGDSNVFGLLRGENGERGTEGTKVEAGDLLVEGLGKDKDLAGLVLAGVLLLPELDLSEGLVGVEPRLLGWFGENNYISCKKKFISGAELLKKSLGKNRFDVNM